MTDDTFIRRVHATARWVEKRAEEAAQRAATALDAAKVAYGLSHPPYHAGKRVCRRKVWLQCGFVIMCRNRRDGERMLNYRPEPS